MDYLIEPIQIDVIFPETWWRVRETDISATDWIDHQFESRPQPNLFGQIICAIERVFDEGPEVGVTPGLEHEPGLEGVDLAAALDRHVASVVVDVVKLVLLKMKLTRL